MSEYHPTPAEESDQNPVIQRSRKQFSILAVQERRVIMALRVLLSSESALKKTDHIFFASLPKMTREAFQCLAEECTANELKVFALHSTFVSEDELAILSRIILFQRPTQSRQWRIANSFQQALKYCAEALVEDGRRLLPRVGLCDAYTDRGGCFLIETTADVPQAMGSDWNGSTEPTPGSLKATALAIVRAHRIVRTAQFKEAGISNQYLSLLCKWGYIEKVGHGFYRYPKRLSQEYQQVA